MSLYELTHAALHPVAPTTLHEQSFREREDLQRLLKKSISVLGDDLFLLAEEYSQWEDSRRRVDLLALDRTGAIVVIELKRSEDGGHMELQALRYAAMVSTLTFTQAVAAHAVFLKAEVAEAEATILDFLKSMESLDDFGHTVRLLLVSPDFSREITTTVLWLNGKGLDIRCVRLKPYRLDDRTLLEIEQIIPLPEAQDFIVRQKEKQEEARHAVESTVDFTRYDLTLNGETLHNLWKRNLMWHVVSSAVKAGLTLDALTSMIPARKIVVVEGLLRGTEFHVEAEKVRRNSGYVFRPTRLFIDDDHLISIEGKTIAISNNWGLPSLPIIDQIIKAVPSLSMSYRPTERLSD